MCAFVAATSLAAEVVEGFIQCASRSPLCTCARGSRVHTLLTLLLPSHDDDDGDDDVDDSDDVPAHVYMCNFVPLRLVYARWCLSAKKESAQDG